MPVAVGIEDFFGIQVALPQVYRNCHQEISVLTFDIKPLPALSTLNLTTVDAMIYISIRPPEWSFLPLCSHGTF